MLVTIQFLEVLIWRAALRAQPVNTSTVAEREDKGSPLFFSKN